MWVSAGLFRDRERLRGAVDALQAQEARLDGQVAGPRPLSHADWRRASIVTVAALIARAALRREESRGVHFRTDFPARDDSHWKVHVSDVIHHS
jgi:L-aspartate oxidase